VLIDFISYIDFHSFSVSFFFRLLWVGHWKKSDRQGLVGTIPLEIGHLTSLQYFSLKNNEGLVGTIPPTISKLQALKQLALHSNNLTGTLPTELFTSTSLSQLEYINLERNWLKGTIPYNNDPSVSSSSMSLHNLQTLVLSHNALTGDIPLSTLCQNSPSLKYLALDSNRFHDGFNSSIQDCSVLQFLYLQNNQFKTSEGASFIPNSSNNITTSYLISTKSVSTTSLHASTTTIPSEIGMLSNLRSINLDKTGIFGDIPTTIGHLQRLQYMSMESNFLSGTLPTEMNQMVSLQTMQLSSNRIGGVIPTLTSLYNLRHIVLFSNQFKGSLINLVEKHPFLGK
jgi:Leucine-rich repeat (LRR) protein